MQYYCLDYTASRKSPHLSSQILCLCAFHVVEDEEERLRGQPREEVYRVVARRRYLTKGNYYYYYYIN